MPKYNFYGWETADVPAVNEEYKEIKNPRHLYDLLSDIWCAETCAPRMRDSSYNTLIKDMDMQQRL